MKKVLSILTIATISAISLFAQFMEPATSMYTEGVTALNAGDKVTSIGYFEDTRGQSAI